MLDALRRMTITLSCLAVSGCVQRATPAESTIARAPTAREVATAATATPAPVDVVRAFLAALQSHDRDELRRRSCAHFEFRTTERTSDCPTRADGPEELERIIECLRDDALLRKELAFAHGLAESATLTSEVPEWAATWMTSETRGFARVRAYINGDGVTFSFVVLTRDSCVAWLMLTAEFERG